MELIALILNMSNSSGGKNIFHFRVFRNRENFGQFRWCLLHISRSGEPICLKLFGQQVGPRKCSQIVFSAGGTMFMALKIGLV
jgi:hypothetical protein